MLLNLNSWGGTRPGCLSVSSEFAFKLPASGEESLLLRTVRTGIGKS